MKIKNLANTNNWANTMVQIDQKKRPERRFNSLL